MFKYNKLKIGALLFIAVFFLIAALFFTIETHDLEALGFLIIPIFLTIHLIKMFTGNIALSRYEEAMDRKDYDLADIVLDKYIKRYRCFKVLKVNLLLIKGDSDLYLYNYNNFEFNFNKKVFANYCYLLESYKIYYDLLNNKAIDFSKVNNIKGLESAENFTPKICCDAIADLQSGKAQEAYDKAKHLVNEPSVDFSKFVYAYVQYLAAKDLGLDLDNYKKVLSKLAYNDYLKQIIEQRVV